MSYIVKGKMIGGFALIAYPAEYGNSGVMTFMGQVTPAQSTRGIWARTRRTASGV